MTAAPKFLIVLYLKSDLSLLNLNIHLIFNISLRPLLQFYFIMNAGTSTRSPWELDSNYFNMLAISKFSGVFTGISGSRIQHTPFNVTNSEYQSTKAFKCKGSYIQGIVEFLDLKGHEYLWIKLEGWERFCGSLEL
ncbi:hypothetical protein CDAR_221661 [Caerostris darwini]|uniref:Uncharacterized protein n=1 Tax=Caerostris darwini TaxID=1538125 RepID=A0AAV4WKW0_9ARAC|nr:hypothetical protein CDAR_221661 [Caerostris darwini]